MDFPQLFLKRFLEWQNSEGSRKTIGEYAVYLGIAQTTASAYMNGTRKPEGDTLRKLSYKLGFEVYDVLNLPRPDEDLAYISQHWDDVSPEFRQQFRKEVEKHLENGQLQRVPKNRRARANS